ncbi:hypothetical protein TNCV_2898161 [Trichonephila clavipes]|nr:hypothetical protein TNCV_2898161 [Trichonephila clavipes]
MIKHALVPQPFVQKISNSDRNFMISLISVLVATPPMAGLVLDYKVATIAGVIVMQSPSLLAMNVQITVWPRSALFHTTGSTTTERPSIKTDSPLLYEMTSLLRTSASPPMSPHQSSCSNHTAKESTAPREPQRTLKTLYYFTQDSKRTHD